MPRCLECNEIFADKLRRCPHCGALPASEELQVVDVREPESVPLTPLGHIARRNRRRRLVALSVGASALLLSVVISLPGARPDDLDDMVGPERVLGNPEWDVPVVPPDELAAADAAKNFAVERAEAVAGGVLVSGTCSPDAIARVLVGGRPAPLSPDARRFRVMLRGAPPETIEVVAEGVKGDRKAVTVPVKGPAKAGGPILRMVSHANGATVYADEVRARFVPDDGGPPRNEALKLRDGENEILVDGNRFWLHRAPAGLTYLRTTSAGHHVYLRERDGQEMVLVPGGMSFRGMGADRPHGPRHLVRLDPFLIDRAEVTCAQYSRFLRYMQTASDGAVRHLEDPGVGLRPLGWEGEEPPEGAADLPVTGICWFAAYAYSRWVGGRLPTEAEWERAAAGPEGRPYPWGAQIDPAVCRQAAPDPQPALSLLGGASYYGVLHMAGNVREWCEDRYDPRWYLRVSRVNPRGPARNSHHVVRGGSFESPPRSLRCQYRDHLAATSKTKDVGFRVARRWLDSSSD